MATIAEILFQSMVKNISDEDLARLNDGATRFVTWANNFLRQAEEVSNKVVRFIEQEKRGHKRQALLQIYRKRHSWKKADIDRLQTYPLSAVGLRRVAKLKTSKRLGRGSTLGYVSISDGLTNMAQYFAKISNPATPPHIRLKLLKKTKWYGEFVEMTYRGEYLRMKKDGEKRVSDRAGEAVIKAFRISDGKLRVLRWKVNKDFKTGSPMSPPMCVEDFEYWLKNGQFPEET